MLLNIREHNLIFRSMMDPTSIGMASICFLVSWNAYLFNWNIFYFHHSIMHFLIHNTVDFYLYIIVYIDINVGIQGRIKKIDICFQKMLFIINILYFGCLFVNFSNCKNFCYNILLKTNINNHLEIKIFLYKHLNPKYVININF